MRRAEVALNSVLAVLALSLVGSSFSLKLTDRLGPGPGFMPLVIGVCLLLVVIPGLGAALRRPEDGTPWLPVGPERRRALLVLGSAVVAVALVPVLGMRTVMPVFIAFLMRTLERHSWQRVIGVSLGAGAFLYVVFEMWLKVPLPVGLFGF